MAKLGQGTAAGIGQVFFCATQGRPVTAVGPSGKAALPGSPVLQRWLRSSCILQSQALQAAYAKKANRTARSQRWRAGEGKQMPRLRLLPGGGASTPVLLHLHPARAPACNRWPHTHTSTAPGGISQGREGTHSLHPPGRRATPRHREGCGRCGRAAGTWGRADRGRVVTLRGGAWHPALMQTPSAERGTELSFLEIKPSPSALGLYPFAGGDAQRPAASKQHPASSGHRHGTPGAQPNLRQHLLGALSLALCSPWLRRHSRSYSLRGHRASLPVPPSRLISA